MFRGVANLNLDAKGRVAIPVRYRARLADKFGGKLVVTVDPEHCLVIYPLKVWEDIERKLDQLPTFNPSARTLQRLLIGHATECELDSHGRIMVSAPLREFAGISKKAVLMGQNKKFELWDEVQFEAKRSQWMEGVKDLNAIDLPEDFASIAL